MKKILLLVLFLPLVSCSYLTEFFIYNNTEAPITIEYQAKRQSDNDPFVTKPKVVSFKSFKKTKTLENQPTINIDITNLIVRTTIQPKQALWVGADTNFGLNNPSHREKLRSNIEYLTITSKAATITADSTNVLDYFKAFDSGHIGILAE